MNRLKHLRGERTQEKMASELGLPRATYSNYETGAREPDQETLIKMADYFDVSVDYLLGRTDIKKPQSDQKYIIPPELEDVGIAFAGGAKNLTQEDLNVVASLIKTLQNKNNPS